MGQNRQRIGMHDRELSEKAWYATYCECQCFIDIDIIARYDFIL
jgi:hypothetical protein